MRPLWAGAEKHGQPERDIGRLNDYPLTDGEMQQILEQITSLHTPLKLNGFINGRTVSAVRDSPEDTQHFGKEISLKNYDRRPPYDGAVD